MVLRIQIQVLPGTVYSDSEEWDDVQRARFRRLLDKLHDAAIPAPRLDVPGFQSDALSNRSVLSVADDDASLDALVVRDDETIVLLIFFITLGADDPGPGDGDGPGGGADPDFGDGELLTDAYIHGDSSYAEIEQIFGEPIGAPGTVNRDESNRQTGDASDRQAAEFHVVSPGSGKKVFISYSREDFEFGKVIRDTLSALYGGLAMIFDDEWHQSRAVPEITVFDGRNGWDSQINLSGAGFVVGLVGAAREASRGVGAVSSKSMFEGLVSRPQLEQSLFTFETLLAIRIAIFEAASIGEVVVGDHRSYRLASPWLVAGRPVKSCLADCESILSSDKLLEALGSTSLDPAPTATAVGSYSNSRMSRESAGWVRLAYLSAPSSDIVLAHGAIDNTIDNAVDTGPLLECAGSILDRIGEGIDGLHGDYFTLRQPVLERDGSSFDCENFELIDSIFRNGMFKFFERQSSIENYYLWREENVEFFVPQGWGSARSQEAQFRV